MDLSNRAVRMRVNKRFRDKGIPAKACSKCLVVKGHTGFAVQHHRPDGRQSYCRECQSATANRERKAQTNRRWYEANRQRSAETTRQWRAANRERQVEINRRWYEANRERQAETSRRWYEANRERQAEADRRWRAANPDKARTYRQARQARDALVPTEPFTADDLRHDWEDHDLYACFFCGGSLTDGYDVEHFYPKFPDDEETTPRGPHALWNLVPSCVPCNRGVDGKHSKEPWQFLRDSLAEQGTDLDACLAGLEATAEPLPTG